MADIFASTQRSPEGPYWDGAPITLHDTNLLTQTSSALMATVTAGLVTVVGAGGSTFNVYLPLGIAVPVRAVTVKATGATAAGVVALW